MKSETWQPSPRVRYTISALLRIFHFSFFTFHSARAFASGPRRDYNQAMPELSRERFVEQVFAIVKARFPLVKLSRAQEPFTVSVNDHMVSLENLYRLATLAPEDLKHNVERWVVEIIRASEGAPDREGSFEQLKDRIYPMILPEGVGEAHRLTVTQPLLEGLNIAYAIDSDRTIAYLSQAQFSAWNMSVEQLHETA